MRLFRVELTRFFSRILVWVGMVGLLGVVVLSLVGSWFSSRPMSAADLAWAKTNYDQAVEDWAENGEQYLAECQEQETLAKDSDPEADFGCDGMEPDWNNWVGTPSTFVDVAERLLLDFGPAVLLFAFLVGVSFVAAEFTSGAMGNWLIFEPRRMRVLGAKAVAAGVGVLPATLVTAALIVGGTAAIYSARGLLGEPTGELWGMLGWATARLSLLAVGFAILGVGIGTLLRHTAAAIGTVVGYLVVVELIGANVFESLKPWLLLINIEAVLLDGTTYGTTDCTMTTMGQSCDWVEHSVSLDHGVTVLLVVLVVTLGAAFAVFRRRDVN